MWSGASNAIPDGWALCNGSNGTPDLRNRFIVGAGDSYGVGATGGEATHTLTVAEMPSHNHTFTGTAHNHSGSISLSGLYATINWALDPGGSDPYGSAYFLGKSNDGGTRDGTINLPVSGSGTVTVNSATVGGTIGNSGSGSAHENRPPYYALCFIMKL